MADNFDLDKFAGAFHAALKMVFNDVKSWQTSSLNASLTDTKVLSAARKKQEKALYELSKEFAKKRLDEDLKDVKKAAEYREALENDIQEIYIKNKQAELARDFNYLKTKYTAELNAIQELETERLKLRGYTEEQIVKITEKAQEDLTRKSEKLAKEAKKRTEKEQKQAAAKIARDKTKSKEARAHEIATANGWSEEAAMDFVRKTSRQSTTATALSAITGLNLNDKDAIAAFGEVGKKFASFTNKLNSDIEAIGGMLGVVDTRLQGSKQATSGGSYWRRMSDSISAATSTSNLISQSAVVNSVKEMINQGISFNVDQRAALAVMSESIASTFNATDGTLLRLIRIQEQDSTAARLGMESALTSFLNNMYETTEYMGSIADGIRANLETATALMTATDAVAFEYQVQKWMGSMYSTGMTQGTVSGLAAAIGQLASGDVSALTSGGAGNLIMMAANKAGISIGEILKGNVGSDQINSVLAAATSYMGDLYSGAGGNNLLLTEFGKIFGVSAADLKAASSLNRSAASVYGNTMTSTDMMNRLVSMAGTMGSRISAGQQVTNVLENLKYSIAAGIANSPGLYTTLALADMLEAAAGGVVIPDVHVMGNAVSFGGLSVADIMKMSALGGGILGSAGNIIGSLGATLNGGQGLLQALGIGSGMTAVQRGGNVGSVSFGAAGFGTSSSGYVGNAESGAVENFATQEHQTQVEAAKEETQDDTTLGNVNSTLLQIYDLLSTTGIKLAGYGSSGL